MADKTESSPKTKRCHICPICSHSFSVPSRLQLHMITHSAKEYENLEGIGNHECSICKKRFSTPSKLLKHIQSHEPPKEAGKSIEKPKRSQFNRTPDGKYLCMLCGSKLNIIMNTLWLFNVLIVHFRSLQISRHSITSHGSSYRNQRLAMQHVPEVILLST